MQQNDGDNRRKRPHPSTHYPKLECDCLDKPWNDHRERLAAITPQMWRKRWINTAHWLRQRETTGTSSAQRWAQTYKCPYCSMEHNRISVRAFAALPTGYTHLPPERQYLPLDGGTPPPSTTGPLPHWRSTLPGPASQRQEDANSQPRDDAAASTRTEQPTERDGRTPGERK
jgi:hypothetical protein